MSKRVVAILVIVLIMSAIVSAAAFGNDDSPEVATIPETTFVTTTSTTTTVATAQVPTTTVAITPLTNTPTTVTTVAPTTTTTTVAPVTTSSGPAPRQVAVPDVVGLWGDLGWNELAFIGLSPVMVDQIVPINSPDVAQVLSQSIPPGTVVPIGTTVEIVVAKEQAVSLITVPNVVGLSQTDAMNLVQSLGLNLGLRDEVQSSAPSGSIVYQSIAAGSEVQAGTWIEFDVAVPVAVTTTAPQVETRTVQHTINSAGVGCPADTAGLAVDPAQANTYFGPTANSVNTGVFVNVIGAPSGYDIDQSYTVTVELTYPAGLNPTGVIWTTGAAPVRDGGLQVCEIGIGGQTAVS